MLNYFSQPCPVSVADTPLEISVDIISAVFS
jgi:hypothetical protein